MSKNTLHIAYVAAGLTPTGYAETLRNLDGQITGEVQARIESAIKPLLNMALTDARKFLRDTVQATKATKEAKPDATVKVRASEAAQILGAVKLIKGFDYAGLGWHAAVSKARDALKGAALKPDGGKRLTDAEKTEEAIKDAGRKQLAELMVSDLPDEAKLKKLAEIKATAAAQVLAEEATDQARRIIKGRGLEYARNLVGALERQIAHAEAEAIAKPEGGEAEVVIAKPAGKKAKSKAA